MKELTLEEAQELLQIDKNSLDIVCVEQPELFSVIAMKHIEAVNLRDASREAVATGDAEISNALRLSAEETGAKLTEAKLSQQVLVHETHKKLNDKYLKLKLEGDQWAVLRESFLQRASMVKLLCELYLADYFSTKSVTSNESKDKVVGKQLIKRKKLVFKKRERSE